MAYTRCIKCSSLRDFSHYRGFKLSEQRCSCGGTFQRVTFVKYLPQATLHKNNPSENIILLQVKIYKSKDGLFSLNIDERKFYPFTDN